MGRIWLAHQNSETSPRKCSMYTRPFSLFGAGSGDETNCSFVLGYCSYSLLVGVQYSSSYQFCVTLELFYHCSLKYLPRTHVQGVISRVVVIHKKLPDLGTWVILKYNKSLVKGFWWKSLFFFFNSASIYWGSLLASTPEWCLWNVNYKNCWLTFQELTVLVNRALTTKLMMLSSKIATNKSLY